MPSSKNIMNENIEDLGTKNIESPIFNYNPVKTENPEDLFKKKPQVEDDHTKKGKEDIRETYLKSAFQADFQIDEHIFVSPGPSKHTRPNYYRGR